MKSRKYEYCEINSIPYLEEKGQMLRRASRCRTRRRRERIRKKWYKKHTGLLFKLHVKHKIDFLVSLKLPKYLSFLRWVLVDFIRVKPRKFWGVYQFVAMPGQGKTLSMVAQLERNRQRYPDCRIYTNFHYKYEDGRIDHWTDMIRYARECRDAHVPCVLAVDEVHITFDSADWKNFPAEILAILSFNRKYRLQFLCSSQIYERIPKKIRDVANYTVICKNILDMDRLFRCYYYEKADYDSLFAGKRVKADFIREYIADDYLYGLYDTLEQVDVMTKKAAEERARKEEAFDLLFGGDSEQEGAG